MLTNISGAIVPGAANAYCTLGQTGHLFGLVYLDASHANAIYGASEHVQPQGITFNVVIVFE